jgi:hypothetical protein
MLIYDIQEKGLDGHLHAAWWLDLIISVKISVYYII